MRTNLRVLSDYLDRTLGLGYIKSSIMLFCAVIAVLLIWRALSGSISVDRITNRTNGEPEPEPA